MFASPFDDSNFVFPQNNLDESNDIINQKRHKRTQKKYPKIENFNTNKVNSVLEEIHNNLEENEDEDNFNPPPKPESAGVQKTIPKQESFNRMDVPLGNKYVGNSPMPNYENTNNLDLNDYNNYGDSKTIEDYYKRVLPAYRNPVNRPYYKQDYKNQDYQNPDIILQKLNYMISLLEDKHDEKTNNVTEEVILYSFLGIFIIFIADAFVKKGKYVR